MVIGIGGCSWSGKTTLAGELAWFFRTKNLKSIVLHQDYYVNPLKNIPKIGDETDWESPDSIDFELLKKALDFHKSLFDVVILEGILAFFDSDLNQSYDYTFFVEISESTFRQRKATDTRWGEIPTWYIDHIWQSYLTHNQPPADLTNLTRVSGEQPYDMPQICAILTQ